MAEIFKYGHLTTKIRAMKGKMLTEADYNELLQKKSVKDVANYLKTSTYYVDTFKDLDESDVHRGYIEILLQQSILADAIKISKYLRGTEKQLYRFIYRKHEIEDLKKMLRLLTTGKSLSEIDRRSLFINKYSKIDFNAALASKNIRELIDSLKNTRFYSLLNPLYKSDTGLDLFSAESALDLYYYNVILKNLQDYSRDKQDTMIENIIRMEVDLKNIFMIYRGKKYYQVSKELMHLYHIPFYYKLKEKDIIEMIEAPSAEEVLQIISSKYYSKKILFHQSNWERQYYRFMRSAISKCMRDEPLSMAPVMGYIYLKEIESMNITTIVEGIRYNVEPHQIKELLVGNF